MGYHLSSTAYSFPLPYAPEFKQASGVCYQDIKVQLNCSTTIFDCLKPQIVSFTFDCRTEIKGQAWS